MAVVGVAGIPVTAPAAEEAGASAPEGAEGSDSLMRTPLVLMAPRADGVEAVWAVRSLSRGRVEWEAEDGATGTAASDGWGLVPQSDGIMRVRLSGLAPGKAYRIRAVTTDVASGRAETTAWKPFRTLEPSASTSRFVVWNDTHLHDATIRKLDDVTPGADFLLWNGDTCNDWTSEELLIPALLHPGGRDISNGRPVFVLHGNHDVRGPHAFRMQRVVATPEGRPYFAFRSGPVACICLHTGEDKPDTHPSFRGRVAFDGPGGLRAEQTAWLAEVIRRPEMRDAPYRVVFCHIPLRWRIERTPDYDNGGYDWHSGRCREAWHSHLAAWGAQVVISGHTHETWWAPATDEVPYAQITGGGPQEAGATWIEGAAGPDELGIRIHDLSGRVKHDLKFPRLA